MLIQLILLKSSLEKILNLRLTLPIRFGELAIRRIPDICRAAFLSSVHGVKKLVSQMQRIMSLLFTIMMKPWQSGM
jgi:hypothetical protein